MRRPTAALPQNSLTAARPRTAKSSNLNLLNAAEAQKMSEMQSQGVLQACLASEMTVSICSSAMRRLLTSIRRPTSRSSEPPTTPARQTKATPGTATCHDRKHDAPGDATRRSCWRSWPRCWSSAEPWLTSGTKRQRQLWNASAQYELFRQQVEKDKKKHSSAAANEGKTWQKYIP